MQVAARAGGGGGGALAVALGVARAEGVRGLFAGLGPLLLRDLPLNAVMFGTFKAVSRALAPPAGASAAAGGWRDFVAGGVAGTAAWAAVYPADVVKSRVQVAGAAVSGAEGGGGSTPSTRQGGSTLSTLRAIVREGGPRALYRGCSAALTRAFVANAALFWGVHAAADILGAQRRA